MEKTRLTYLDMAKGIGIVLVVLGHSTLTSDGVQAYLTAFHMPLFFVISGILLWVQRQEEKPVWDFLVRKCRTVLVPYFSFSLLAIGVELLLFYITGQELQEEISTQLLRTATLCGFSVFWFLPALLGGELLFLALRRWADRLFKDAGSGRTDQRSPGQKKDVFTGLAAIATAVIGIWPVSVTVEIIPGMIVTLLLRVCAANAFLTLGYYLGRLFEGQLLGKRTCRDPEKGKPLLELPLALLFFAIVYFCSKSNGTVDLNYRVFGNPFLYYLAAVCGSLAVILLCRQIPLEDGLLCFLGRNSLIVLVTHLDLQVLQGMMRLAYWVTANWFDSSTVLYYGFTAICMLAAESLLILLINGCFPFLIGKGYRRHLPAA